GIVTRLPKVADEGVVIGTDKAPVQRADRGKVWGVHSKLRAMCAFSNSQTVRTVTVTFPQIGAGAPSSGSGAARAPFGHQSLTAALASALGRACGSWLLILGKQ